MLRNPGYSFDTINRQFSEDYQISLKPNSTQKYQEENFKIFQRLIYLCNEEKNNLTREHNLYVLIHHSLKNLKKSDKLTKLRTIRLLSEDCPITLQKMLIITDHEAKEESDAILNLTTSGLTSQQLNLNTQDLEDKVKTLFSTDNMGTVYSKCDKTPIHGADPEQINQTTINFEALASYTSLCHILEDNPLLLNLNPEFLCTTNSYNTQLAILKSKANREKVDLLKQPEGIALLNFMGVDTLYQIDGEQTLNDFYTFILSIPNGISILITHKELFKLLSFDYFKQHGSNLFSAIGDSNKIKQLALENKEFCHAIKTTTDFNFIQQHFSLQLLEKELPHVQSQRTAEQIFYQDILIAYVSNHALPINKWLALLSTCQPSDLIFHFLFKIYLEKQIATFKSIEQWIASVDPQFQIKLFDFLEAQKTNLNYFSLYTLSDTLKKHAPIQVEISAHKNFALTQLRSRYVFAARDQKLINQNKNYFKNPPPCQINLDEKIVEKIKVDLANYKKNYLYVDKIGDVNTSYFTPFARGIGYKALISELLKEPIVPEQLQQVLSNIKFQQQIGEDKFYPIRPLAFVKPLIQWANQRHKIQRDIEQYWSNRHQICKKVKSNDILLLELLLDIDVLNSLTPYEMSILFENGNKGLFAEIILQAYPGKVFPDFKWHGNNINHEFLKMFVPLAETSEELNRINKARFEYKIDQYIPLNAKYPGVNPSDAALTKEQLYQLQDSDITVGEQILREEFKGLIKPIKYRYLLKDEIKPKDVYKKMSGRLGHQDEEYIEIQYDKSEKSTEIKSLSAGPPKLDTIYLVPIAATKSVLINPELKKHPHLTNYQEFKNIMRFMVESLPLLSDTCIIAGICNLDANHYAPYFIHRNNDGIINVLTIDPSNETSPVLTKCFKDIFPKCHYHDAHIPQQIRQRDCGFNSLESIRSVATNINSNSPIISIENGILHLNTEALTVNGEPYRCYNFQENQHFFLNEFIQQGERNRQRWATLFSQKTQVNFSDDSICDYNYEYDVNKQETNDQFGDYLSVISGCMVSTNILEDYRAQYRTELALPTPQQLEKIRMHLIQTKMLSQDILENKDCTESIYTICKINFKDDTADGLLNIFRHLFLPRYTIDKDTLAETIFLAFTKTDKYIEFSKYLLSPALAKLKQEAIAQAHQKISAEVLSLKQKFIEKYIQTHIEAIVKSLQTSPESMMEAILDALKTHQEIQADLAFLLNDPESKYQLIKYIMREIHHCIDVNTEKYWSHLENHAELWQLSTIMEDKEINIFALEKIMTQVLEDKFENIPHNAIYYTLVQNTLAQKYQDIYLHKIDKQLNFYVDHILDNPQIASYIKTLNFKEQRRFMYQQNFSGFFNDLEKYLKYSVTDFTQNTFHTQTLNKIVSNRLSAVFKQQLLNYYMGFWDQLMATTACHEVNDLTGALPLKALCLAKRIPLSSEEIEDFVNLYQDFYIHERHQNIKNLTAIHKQLPTLHQIIVDSYKYDLINNLNFEKYTDVIKTFENKFAQVIKLPLSQFQLHSNELLDELNQTFRTFAKELYDNPLYQVTMVTPGSYTLRAQHVLSTLFNIEQPKKILLVKEHIELDAKLKKQLEQPDLPVNLQPSSRLLLDKFESKELTRTYCKPLTQRMLLECLLFWKAHRSHIQTWQSDSGFPPVYFQLIDFVNFLPSQNLDEEISELNIKALKKILKINNDYYTHFKIWSEHPSTAATQALGAILNSESLSKKSYEAKPAEPLTFIMLKKLLDLNNTDSNFAGLPMTTQTLLSELKLEGLKFCNKTSNDASGMVLLKNTINLIDKRHACPEKQFILDFTDIQILKQTIAQYVNIERSGHNFLAHKNNTVTDNIYILLAVFIQANTPEPTSVIELLMPECAISPSLKKAPLMSLVKHDRMVMAKESSDFYENLLNEARKTTETSDMKNIEGFIDLISRFDQVNLQFIQSKVREFNLKFKWCVVQAKKADQLPLLFKKIAKKDEPLAEFIENLEMWGKDIAIQEEIAQERRRQERIAHERRR